MTSAEPFQFLSALGLTTFPYALSTLPQVLATEWDSTAFAPYRSAFPEEHSATPDALLSHVRDLMSQDLKIPYLKSLQGYLWLSGYESGALKCPLFPDIYPSLKKWHEAGIPLIIYSSGSVSAQKLLFKYTNVTEADADLNPLLSGYFDTVNAGLKNDPSSYVKIYEAKKEETGTGGDEGIEKWLFLSDNVKEVEAAQEAGMQSLVVVREGNAPLSEDDEDLNMLVESFEEIEIVERLAE